MTGKPLNVLFLCTHNSARSIMAEAILTVEGKGRFNAFSAGSEPAGRVHPYTLDLLKTIGFPTDNLRSKSWDEFAEDGAPVMDFVFTVCDSAAAETCPVWPRQPMTAHWGFPDPAAFEGTEAEKRAVFADVYRQIQTRIGIFVNLPIERLGGIALKRKLDDIGRS